MSVRISIATLALGLALVRPVAASDVGYLYGRVETVGGQTYKGQLRWGTEEAFWDDIFNATKAENENIRDLDDKSLDRVKAHKWSGWDFLGIQDPTFDHLFAIRFGDLKKIQVRGEDGLVVQFRNSEELKLKGGSNDVGAEVTVVDPKSGEIGLKWSRIRSIEFLETPAKLEDKLGEPIYGTVTSGRVQYTGRIQWDNDECLTSDELDGHGSDGKVSIPFKNIATIRKVPGGSLVRLNSGKEMRLNGTNDVNSENRGVVVVEPMIGTLKIGWQDFDEVRFTSAPNTGRSYAQYTPGEDLHGTVVTRAGKRLVGRLVFDLDESWDFEMLHGRNGDTEYLIPFREIARIRPRGGYKSDVELKVGLTIGLEDSEDVTRKNDGMLIFAGPGKPTYVAWREVSSVEFR